MEFFQNFTKYSFLFGLTLIPSFLFEDALGRIYLSFFNINSVFSNTASVDGFFITYSFFISLLFTIWGERNKYKWLAVFYAPLIMVLLSTNDAWLFILLGLAGWGIGLGSLQVYKFFVH